MMDTGDLGPGTELGNDNTEGTTFNKSRSSALPPQLSRGLCHLRDTGMHDLDFMASEELLLDRSQCEVSSWTIRNKIRAFAQTHPRDGAIYQDTGNLPEK